MSSAFHEYLELYQYFGRGGFPRLDKVQFEAILAEFEALVARAPDLSTEELEHTLGLRDLLLRERPKRTQLTRRR
ncbi:MAG: hypothetical protein JRH20_04565 [Deltaproteobacteria bacterium]|nr:hypothetical protein [Deltaproteobacteria bacterium]